MNKRRKEILQTLNDKLKEVQAEINAIRDKLGDPEKRKKMDRGIYLDKLLYWEYVLEQKIDIFSDETGAYSDLGTTIVSSYVNCIRYLERCINANDLMESECQMYLIKLLGKYVSLSPMKLTLIENGENGEGE